MAPTTNCPQGPQEPVFDIIKCDVPCIFPIPDDNWVVNPQVPVAPEDINDCPSVPIPLVEPEPLCVPITYDGRLQANQDGNWGGQAEVRVVPIGQEKADFSIIKGECCDYDFKIKIDFPCPELFTVTNSNSNSNSMKKPQVR